MLVRRNISKRPGARLFIMRRQKKYRDRSTKCEFFPQKVFDEGNEEKHPAYIQRMLKTLPILGTEKKVSSMCFLMLQQEMV